MYSYIVSPPSFSPTCAKTVLTEWVSASVSEMSPKSSPPSFARGTPEILIPLSPLITESGVNWPLSSAAAAVTTFIVEPGG